MGRTRRSVALRRPVARAQSASHFALERHTWRKPIVFEVMPQPANLKSVERVEAKKEVWRVFADKIGGGEWFTVRQSTDGVAHVFIFGDVNFGTHWEKLLSDLSGADDIRLTVSSRGGDSLLGLAFFNAFNKGLVSETRIVGVAGSAAFTMALAGKKILIERNAKILRHAPCSFVYGEANELLCLKMLSA